MIKDKFDDLVEAALSATNNNSNGDPKRHLKVTRLSDITMKATRWLWEQSGDRWIPMGALVGLAGREGVGKSTWCADIIARVTLGELPGDFEGTPKGAVIVTTEDDWEATVKPRLAAAGADLDKVYRVEAVQADGLEDILSLPNDLVELERIVKENDVALIVLDPLLTFVNKKLDTHKDAEVRQALEPVVKLAHNTRSSLIGLIHVNKTSEGDLMNRLMASRAIGAVIRGVLFCASYKPSEQISDENGEDPPWEVIEPKRSRFVFGQIKNNLAAKVMRSIEYHIEGRIVGYDEEAERDIEGSHIVTDRMIEGNVEDIVLEQERRKKNAKTEGGKAAAWLVGYLSGKGEIPSSQIIEDGDKAGHSRDSIYRARRSFGDDRIAIRNLATVPKTSTWRLLEEKLQ
jgi:hypothetical protein